MTLGRGEIESQRERHRQFAHQREKHSSALTTLTPQTAPPIAAAATTPGPVPLLITIAVAAPAQVRAASSTGYMQLSRFFALAACTS
jgi:hypothetical protein